MSQENVQTDTPQNNEAPKYDSLEEAIFDGGFEGSASVDSAFSNPEESKEAVAAPNQGQPANENVETNPTPVQTDNDETRYQYWQSQADKLKHENSQLKDAMNQQAAQQQQVAQEQVSEPVEEFPAPPMKPEKPRTFNRDEAYADPNSESARYLDEVEDWRDNMSEYNNIKTQYQAAVMEEKMNVIQQEKVQEAQRQQAAQQKATQASQIREHVMSNYKMTAPEAQDFINKMSNPKSVNIDNLVQLYRMQNSQTTQNAQPSAEFTQYQNAQQIPSPMGVMPSGQTNVDNRSVEDKIMDTMIGNFDSKNPWK